MVSLLVMLCTLSSRLLGFVRIAVIGALFGASGTADVWNAVFTIPNNFRKLLAEGAFSSAFIPALSMSLVKNPGGETARKITRNVITFQLLILFPFILLALFFARPIIGVLLSFPEAEKMELSVLLFRWIFGYLAFISISAVLVAVLNSHNIFIIPALTPILFSLSVIFSTLLFYRRIGIFSMAIGVLMGGVLQILFQLPVFLRQGYDLKLDFGFRNKEFQRILRNWLPLLLSSSIFAVTQQIAVLFASGLEDGSTSALSNALVFFQLPFGIFSISIITVLFPRMSRQAAAEDNNGLIESLNYGLRFIFALLIPAAIIYLFMSKEIIGLALQRINFTEQNTVMASMVLKGYSLGLFSLGAFTFFQRFFYALQDFKTPLKIALLVSVIDILLSLWLKETVLRVTGLAVANSTAFSIGLFIFFITAKKRLGTIRGGLLLITLTRVGFSMVPLCAFLYFYLKITAAHGLWAQGSSWQNLLLVTTAVGVSLLLVGALYYLTGVEMIRKKIK